MPTSVLLAVLVAAALLALAPALVRRYDAAERLEAERTQSTARVLSRARRRRTVPGPHPRHVKPAPRVDHGPAEGRDQRGRGRAAAPARRPRPTPAIYRRRRALAALVLLNVVKLIGVATVGPGFWIGFAVTGTLLVTYLGYLRQLAVADQRRRRAEARQLAWLAAQQAEVRQEQERRAAQRRVVARRLAEQREALRRNPAAWSADPTVSYRRAAGADPGG